MQFRETIINEQVCYGRIIPAFSARIPDMKRGLHGAKKFDQFSESWITTGISTTADSDPFKVPAFSLKVCKRFISNRFEILKTAVLFPDSTGAIVTPFFEWQAVSAPKWLDTLDFLKITVFAKTPAVDTWAPSDVHGKLCHFRYRSLGLKCIRCLHLSPYLLCMVRFKSDLS
jgi:hypothetical protein